MTEKNQWREVYDEYHNWKIKKYRKTDRQTDRHADRHTDRQTHR